MKSFFPWEERISPCIPKHLLSLVAESCLPGVAEGVQWGCSQTPNCPLSCPGLRQKGQCLQVSLGEEGCMGVQ